jgi:hypothetical protein
VALTAYARAEGNVQKAKRTCAPVHRTTLDAQWRNADKCYPELARPRFPSAYDLVCVLDSECEVERFLKCQGGVVTSARSMRRPATVGT